MCLDELNRREEKMLHHRSAPATALLLVSSVEALETELNVFPANLAIL